jgi:hypothetical protein
MRREWYKVPGAVRRCAALLIPSHPSALLPTLFPLLLILLLPLLSLCLDSLCIQLYPPPNAQLSTLLPSSQTHPNAPPP